MAKNELTALRVGIGAGVTWAVASGTAFAPYFNIVEWFALFSLGGAFIGTIIGIWAVQLTKYYLDTKDKVEYESEVENKRKAKEAEEYLKKEAGL